MTWQTRFAVVVLLAVQPAVAALGQGRPGVDFRDVPEVASERLASATAALISAVSSAESSAVQEFLDGYASAQYRDAQPLEARVQQFRTARWRMGDLQLRGERFWNGVAAGIYAPIVQDQTTGTWWYLELRTVQDDDLRINGFTYNSITAPAFAQQLPLEAKQLPSEIERVVASACARDAFAGAVLVASKSKVLATAACGEASKTFGVPNALDTTFNLASMNKMFTALVVMQLVGNGQLALSETVERYVDSASLPADVARRVTVAQLLSHRSGVTDGNAKSLAFEPGSQFRYSNSGVALFGSVIEAVSGEDYHTAIRRRIYEPAGMTSSESYAFKEVVANVAEPYAFAPHGEKIAFEKSLIPAGATRGGPAGGGYSTVADLHKFAVALLEERIVSAATLETMWTDYSGFNTGFYGYGYGFEIYLAPDGRVVGHGGSAPGASARLEINTRTGEIIVVLSNYGTAAVPLAKRLTDLLARVPD
jgi:CubicO group peptidase (beta-lactamase class C family)